MMAPSHKPLSTDGQQMNASHGGHEPAIAVTKASTDSQDYVPRSTAAQLSPNLQKQPSTSKDADESSSQSTGLLPFEQVTTRPHAAPSRAATWIWEILALIVGILSFVAIIIVLRLYQNRFLSTWTLPITINAIISILTTLFKGALAVPVAEGIGQMKWVWFSQRSRNLADVEIFDRASRGPWGACILLARQFVKSQRSYLVGLGSVVLLISLAVDPFSQATIQYYSCLREGTAELGIFRPDAWIPRTNTFITQGSHLGPQQATLDTRLTLAIYQGLLEPPFNSSVSVPVSCSSGNCTFPDDDGATFTTLAMCHTCVDRSDAVESIPTEYAYNFTFDGISLTPSVAFNSSSGSNQVFRQGAWNWTNEVGFRGLSMTMVDGNFTMSPLAFDCALQPCVKTYAANTTKNIYTEREITRTLLHPLPKLTTTATIWELAVNRTLLSGDWKNCTPSATNTSSTPERVYAPQIQQINASSSDVYQAVNNTPVEWYPEECIYRLDSFGYNSGLDDYLSSFFSNDEFANSLSYYTSAEAAYGSIWFTSLYA